MSRWPPIIVVLCFVAIVLVSGAAVLFTLGRAASVAADHLCEESPNHRFDDIRNSGDARKLIGLSKDQLIARFHAPPADRFPPEWDATYRMRPQGFCMDSWYVALDYDDRGIVTSAAVVGD